MFHFSAITVQDHTFIDSALGPDSIILDCGGFHGAFSEAVTRRFGCTCHVLEPASANSAHIPDLPGILKHALALSTENGEAEFHLAVSPICNSLKELPAAEQRESVRVQTTSLGSFMETHAIRHVDLLKLDIEGMEMEVLETLPREVLARIDQITVEFHHPFIHPRGSDRQRMNALVHRLKRAGFTLIMPLRPIYFDILFVQTAALSMGALDRLVIALRHDHWPRVVRAARKRLLPSAHHQPPAA